MPKIAVYRFQVYDSVARAWRRAEGWGTAAHIAACNGATLFNTKRHVDPAEVGSDGFCADRPALPR